MKKKIDWFQEIRISFLTSILFLIFTTLCFWIVHCFSPGEFYGDTLDRYLRKSIDRELDSVSTDAVILFDEIMEVDRSDKIDNDIILVCGTYKGNADNSNGKFISLFERKKYNFWNELFGTKPSFVISSFYHCKLEEYRIEDTLLFEKADIYDLDSNGKNDIIIEYSTKFADRHSKANIFFMKTEKGWEIKSPDLNSAKEEIRMLIPEDGIIFVESFLFEENSKENDLVYVFSLSMYGELSVIENPIWGKQDYMYYIAVNNGTSVISTDHCAIVMTRFDKNGNLVRDPNWNQGKILLEPCSQVERSMIEEKWGFRQGSLVFYGDDI